jgi:hypothetical protein
MALDPRYVLLQGIDQYFVDKDTGLPLANGELWFYSDTNRNSLKYVYELSGSPPNYTYSPLPNPILLSATGQVVDAAGNNEAIYYLPYSSVNPAQIDLYYIQVFKDGEGPNGIPQYTREAWPNISSVDNPVIDGGSGGGTNQITNSQFVEVLFNDSASLNVPYTGNGITFVQIAPGWILNIEHTGNGSVTVSRLTQTGMNTAPTNPPYLLQVIGGSNIAKLQLIQTLYNNPAIFTPFTPTQGGFVNTGILLGPGTPTTTVSYVPSNSGATTQLLLTASNTSSGVYNYYSQTVQLTPGDNPDSSAVGFVEIVIDLDTVHKSIVSSVQIIGLETNTNLAYDQQTANRQRDYLFHYYKPQLAYKPIPSYLIGWDFPMNPAQLGDSISASSAGANTSAYTWDQTIVYQSANNGIAVSRGGLGEIVFTATNITQWALIQYIDTAAIKSLLQGFMSVNIMGSTSVPGGMTGVVQLYWTQNATLPSLNSPTFDSIVETLDASGNVTNTNGTWDPVDRGNLGNANIMIPATVGNEFFEINLSGWNLLDISAIDDATFGAIVIGFPSLAMGQSVSFKSISLCAGAIATPPAPLSSAETLLQCQQFYFKTFEPDTAPAQNVGVNTSEFQYLTVSNSTTYCPSLFFPTTMRTLPTMTYYNPAGPNGKVRDISNSSDCSVPTNSNFTSKQIVFRVTGANAVGDVLGVHITADARLGVAN